MTGFCDRCHRMLPDRSTTVHTTPDECITILLRHVELMREWADRQHAWVHRLEDEIGLLRNDT